MRARSPKAACILVSVSVLFLLAIAGCNPFAPEQDAPEEEPEFIEKARTSVANIIYNIEGAYPNRRLDVYENQFEVENFWFSYTDRDSNGVPVPKGWDWQEEYRIHENMFDNESHPRYPDNIRLTLSVKELIEVPEQDSLWRCTCAVDLKVDILGTTYWANQDSRFWIGDDEKEGNEGLMLVKYWEDVYEEQPKMELPDEGGEVTWATLKRLLAP
jgi:hypothetical protein